MGHNPTRRSGTFQNLTGRVGSRVFLNFMNRVGSGQEEKRHGLGGVRLEKTISRVGSGQEEFEISRVGSGYLKTRQDQSPTRGSGRVRKYYVGNIMGRIQWNVKI